jgi:hypothetical protein
VRAWLLASLLLLPVLLAIAPHRVSDADALSRLATGRWLVNHGLRLPSSDPFTFADPSVRFGDPEWLGDLTLYALYARFGDVGLQAAVLLTAAAGYTLALGLGMAFGAPASGMLALLLSTLPAVGPRISARNDVHTLWIVPLFAWLAATARGRRAHWLALLALAWLWANLHASFVLAIPLLLAALADSAPDRRQWLPWSVLLIIPALPFFGLGGSSSYAQLYDHVQGAAVYRALISEWQSPLSSGGLLAILPLHVLAVLGLLHFGLAGKRMRFLPLAMFVLGAVLAYRSRRFLPLMAAGMAPAMGVGLLELGARLTQRARLALQVLAGVCLVAYLGLGLRSASHRAPTAVFGASDSPERAARFVSAHAPAGARLANLFDDGPWLVFLSAPRVLHYLDPRNNLGAARLERYVREVLSDPQHFEAEVARLGITLALVRDDDPHAASVAAYLAGAPDWPLVYWDGRHALHARTVETNHSLIAHFGYRIIRPTFDLGYLAGRSADDPALARDLALLDRQSAPLGSALRAYSLLQRGDRASAQQAAQLFESALEQLPASPALLGYWAESLQKAGLVPGEASTGPRPTSAHGSEP